MNIVITGASRGIGRGIAEVAAEHGHTVGLLARSGAALEEFCRELNHSEGRAFFAEADIRDPDQVAGAIAELADDMGGLHALVNNAGVVARKSVLDITVEEWRTVIATNLDGVFYAIKAALPLLTKNETSSIVNVSSVSGRIPLPGGSAYAASKFGLTGFSDSIFAELRDLGVRVTTVFPGSVETDPELLNNYQDWKVTPREIGEAVLQVLQARGQVCINRMEIRPAKAPQKPA